MEKKTYTILIASNRQGRTRKVTVSASWFKALGFIGFVAATLLCAILIDYFGLLVQSNHGVALRAENVKMKKQFEVVQEKLSSLEDALDRVQNFTRKLNLITNIQDQDRTLKLAMTGVPQQGALPVDEGASRKPSSSEFMLHEPEMDEKMAPDEESGELAGNNESLRDYDTLSVRIDRDLKASQLREQGLLQLWDSLSERKSLLAATPSIKPAPGWYTSRFGYRVDPFTGRTTMHAGVDIATPPGTPVHATADGIVTYAGYENGYGKLVAVDNGYGVSTRFGHNSRLFVHPGERVKRGDVLAASGNTGRSTGAHVHYEVRIHGIPVDPMNYILSE